MLGEVIFFDFRQSYQHSVDNSVEKLHLSNDCEAFVKYGNVDNFLCSCRRWKSVK